MLHVGRSRVVLATAWMIAAALVGCGQRPTAAAPQILTDDAVTIGAFDFPESELLARLYGMALEHAGIRVDLQLSLGPRELVEPALEKD